MIKTCIPQKSLLFTLFLFVFLFSCDTGQDNIIVTPIEEEPDKPFFINLPDPVFEAELIARGIDTDGEVNQKMLEEDALNVTYLDLFYSGSDPDEKITDLTGIEGFTNLKELIVGNNALTAISLNENTALEKLYLNSNQLSAIELSNNPALTYLSIGRNELQGIDVSANVNLQYLNLEANSIKSLDVSNNPKLVELSVLVNELSSITGLEQTTGLKKLNLGWNDLESLTLNISSLEWINIEQNLLTNLNVNGCTSLTSLIATNNSLKQLDLHSNVSLQYLKVSANEIEQVDLSKNLALELFWISNNHLAKLDVSKLSKLYDLSIFGNADLSCIKTLDDQTIATVRKGDHQELSAGVCE
ncbi:MAG: hypothetical protein Sapg2KO_53250 [Saprospiraceae bacterium]